MNTVIDNKLFDLITKEENFEFAFDINERFVSIKKRLLADFWYDFKAKLKIEHSDFIIENTSDWEFIFFERKWKIFKFYFNLHSNSMEFGVGSGNPDYINLFPQINERFQELLSDYENVINNNELWYFMSCDDDVTNLQGLKRILPSNRETIIMEYYELFKSLLVNIQEFITEFEDKINKTHANMV